MADHAPATHAEMLPYVVKEVERLQAAYNRLRPPGRDAHVRHAAQSLMCQRLWALVEDLEAGNPVLPFINETAVQEGG